MNTDLWNQPKQPPKKSKRGQPKGNAAPIGSGPAGETCKTCRHAYAVRHAKTYHKCALVKATGGPGTDIRLKWAACSRWESKASPRKLWCSSCRRELPEARVGYARCECGGGGRWQTLVTYPETQHEEQGTKNTL